MQFTSATEGNKIYFFKSNVFSITQNLDSLTPTILYCEAKNIKEHVTALQLPIQLQATDRPPVQ